MPKRIKFKSDPYAEVRRNKGVNTMQDKSKLSLQIKCPYCGSNSTNILRKIDSDGFTQFKCSSCHKIFGKKL